MSGLERSGALDSSPNDRFRAVLGVLRANWWVICVCAFLGGVAASAWSFAQTPTYASNATLYVTSGSDDNAQAAYQGSLASQQRVASYAKLVSSDVIVNDALSRTGLAMSTSDAKRALSATTTPQTVLLTIRAKTDDPFESAELANGVASAMSRFVETLEVPSAGGEALAKLTVVSDAKPNEKPVSPQYSQNVAFGLLLGAVLGVAGTFVRSRLDSRVRTGGEASSVSGSELLGNIPSDSRIAERGVVEFDSGWGAAELYRKLRTNLSYVNVDSGVARIAISSSVSGEGKTTTAINLAIAMAEDGNRVLLLDGDLRNPSIARILGMSESVGFTDMLRGSAVPADVVQTTNFDRLDFLGVGSIAPNPAELLGSNRASEIAESFLSDYDYVIVDTSPVLPVTDALLVSQWVDGVLLVVRQGVTKRSDLSRSSAELGRVGARILGVVVNCVGRTESYGYGYGTYSSAE